ncbi:hypothetical protein UlMin_001626 [Ulmus minor]
MPVAEPVKPSGSSSEGGGDQKHKQLNREVKDMVFAITHRLTDFHKSGSGEQHNEEEDEKGVRIITLTGSNTGATLRGELDEKAAGLHGEKPAIGGESEALTTYVNSNFQAINNSIMMSGTYNTNDPGVHVEISDIAEHKADRKSKKGKKKNKEAFKSEDKSGHSE